MNLELWKRRKKDLKLTLQEISDISGIPKRTVDQIFSGKTTNPRIDTAQAIEKVLGIGGTDWTEEERLQGVVDNLETIITADEFELIMLLRDLEEEKGSEVRAAVQKVFVATIEQTLKS